MKKLIIFILVVTGISLILSIGLAQEKKGKILYYRNPMNASITSKVPMKDEMGMDYIPVYESEASPAPAVGKAGSTTVKLSTEEIERIGVRTVVVTSRDLVKEIRAVGRIAYDPDLVVAQQEYLAVLETNQEPELKNLAKNKLRLLGMSDEQINELEQSKKVQDNLILPGHSAWVYADVYQEDITAVKKGVPIIVTNEVVPGEEFAGTIKAIDPILNEMTRSAKVRAEIANHELKLKPGMYVTAIIKVNLGEKPAVPKEAVLDTGRQKVAWVEKAPGIYEKRNVETGPEAQGYYPILHGLQIGEKVVSRANFLIDSQSIISGGAAEAAYSGAITGTDKKDKGHIHQH